MEKPDPISAAAAKKLFLSTNLGTRHDITKVDTGLFLASKGDCSLTYELFLACQTYSGDHTEIKRIVNEKNDFGMGADPNGLIGYSSSMIDDLLVWSAEDDFFPSPKHNVWTGTPLTLLAVHDRQGDGLRELLKAPKIEPNLVTSLGDTAAKQAVRSNNLAALDALSEHPDFNPWSGVRLPLVLLVDKKGQHVAAAEISIAFPEDAQTNASFRKLMALTPEALRPAAARLTRHFGQGPAMMPMPI